MKSRVARWAVPGATLVIVVAFLVYQGRGAVPPGGDLSALELRLVADKCTKAEAVDRRLLQQSWFYDPGFLRLAAAFDQSSFILFAKETPSKEIEGAFCISGTDLMARYYERRFVPVRVNLSELSVSYGTKLAPLGDDVYSVRELTKDKMILTFASDGREHVFYRKN